VLWTALTSSKSENKRISNRLTSWSAYAHVGRSSPRGLRDPSGVASRRRI
jgi:hypothetical protein